MDEQTRKLLEECSSGCEMGADSMRQISGYIKDKELKQLAEKYIGKHEELKKKAGELLHKEGCSPKEPGTIASAFSWITTEMKLTFKDDNTQIAKILIDGCTMGIKTLGERVNSLSQADSSAVSLAHSIIRMEEDLMKDLQKYL